jgi:DNA polymerase-3 subunit beta
MSITCWIGAKVEEDGAVTLPAKTFADLVSNLSPERVDLTLNLSNMSVNVRCGATNSNIKGIDASEFPLVPHGGSGDIHIPAKVFKEMIKQTVYAAAKEDSRPILTGVYTHFEKDVLTMAAADGYRLAVRTTKLDTPFSRPVEMVVPAKAMQEVERIISDDDDIVGITLPGERDIVLFHLRNVDVATQLLEGRFPDFGSIIPKSYVTATTLYTVDLLRAAKRSEIFARDSANSAKLIVKPPKGAGEPGEVLIMGRSAERGEGESTIDAGVEGESLDISFNVRYLIEVLNVIQEERVIFESNGAAHPVAVRPEGRSDFISIIMPMSLTK